VGAAIILFKVSDPAASGAVDEFAVGLMLIPAGSTQSDRRVALAANEVHAFHAEASCNEQMPEVASRFAQTVAAGAGIFASSVSITRCARW